MGTGGSAAVVMTIVHKRASAGTSIKKGDIISRCTSLHGVADLKGATAKNPLEHSIGGTYKNLMCRRETDPKPAPVGDCSQLESNKYYFDKEHDFPGQDDAVGPGTTWNTRLRKKGEVNKGCGTLEETIEAANPIRENLGYCPIKIEPDGLHLQIGHQVNAKGDNNGTKTQDQLVQDNLKMVDCQY
jgi:hypothetical protein